MKHTKDHRVQEEIRDSRVHLGIRVHKTHRDHKDQEDYRVLL